MARLRVLRGSFQKGPVRATDWRLGISTATAIIVPANSKLLVTSFAAALLTTAAPFTIIRSRFLLGIQSDQAGASEEQLGAFGIGIVNEVARAVGVTGLPGPATDSLWDGWFVIQPIAQRIQVNSAVGFDAQMATQYVIDSKAMRKVEGDEGIVVMVENLHGSHGFTLTLEGRILVKMG